MCISTSVKLLFCEPSWKMLLLRLLLAAFIASTCLTTFASGAAQLPYDEVEALKEILKTLGANESYSNNLIGNACTGQWGWGMLNPLKDINADPLKYSERDNGNGITCSCTFSNNTVCHIISIVLRRQNLPGTLPPELVKLRYLQDIDFTHNYLNGTIPRQWGSTKLVNISIDGNRLTGSIPKELGNITTLVNLTIKMNQFSGVLPPDLGNLSHIERMVLSSNNFTGELPSDLARLTTLKDFRISDNHFRGKIPNFISKWTNLERLFIQASGLEGPIPTGIEVLRKLSDLRISDLNGTEVDFPDLINMTNLKILILRSCNIIGQLPKYFDSMTNLKTLDLSFNKLSGEIPISFRSLSSSADYIYLTGNLLNGPVPEWMERGNTIDLSYNNFSLGNSETFSCQKGNVNVFGSSLGSNNSGIFPCLRSPCSQPRYSLHINCGGEKVESGDTKYEDDEGPARASTVFLSGTYWAFSSTGNFLDDYSRDDPYIRTSTSRLAMNTSVLVQSARLSPLSLTYYGFCLQNGKYKVNLHFAEIMFTDDKTYSSLGRRIFDVYIQRKLVLKDFNIEEKAGGVGKEIIRNFTAVVTSNTLEIRFYWAGKGTTGIPSGGVYGPLISAISVNSESKPPEKSSISAGTVVGIVATLAFIIFLIFGILWWKGCLRQRDRMEHDVKGLDLNTGSFTLRQIKAATNNFDAANKIGEGGFGSVYKGLLSDGTVIAVKQLSSKSKQGNREFVNEIGMISALQHPHLVKLYGCCIEGNQLLVVYEYMENNSLARALFGPEEFQLKLDWPTRHKICVGIARGLTHLHEESRLKIVHRDIKATNVLLDKNLNPKISDFGLAKLDDDENTHISTRIAGTIGYMAPEYAMRGYLTDKADVYSFGIVALEIVSGRSNNSYKFKVDNIYLRDWALVLKQKGNLMELVDPRLGSNFNKEEVTVMINVALLCTNISPAFRPTMSSVVSMLEGRTVVLQELVSVDGQSTASSKSAPDPFPTNLDSDYLENRPTMSSTVSMLKERAVVIDPSAINDEMKLKTWRKQNQHSQEDDMSVSLIHTMSIDGPQNAASTSAPDLYPINLDSDYWEHID